MPISAFCFGDYSTTVYAKYQPPKETSTVKYTDKTDRQTNTKSPIVIARIVKSDIYHINLIT